MLGSFGALILGGVLFMILTVEATVANGQLKLKEPISLPEGTLVRVAVTPVVLEEVPPDPNDPLEAVIGICDDGPPISLAERHEEFIYVNLLRREPKQP